jgi:hypothetical protein
LPPVRPRSRVYPKTVTAFAAARVNPRWLVISAILAKKMSPTKAHAYTITVKSWVSTAEYPKPYHA